MKKQIFIAILAYIVGAVAAIVAMVVTNNLEKGLFISPRHTVFILGGLGELVWFLISKSWVAFVFLIPAAWPLAYFSRGEDYVFASAITATVLLFAIALFLVTRSGGGKKTKQPEPESGGEEMTEGPTEDDERLVATSGTTVTTKGGFESPTLGELTSLTQAQDPQTASMAKRAVNARLGASVARDLSFAAKKGLSPQAILVEAQPEEEEETTDIEHLSIEEPQFHSAPGIGSRHPRR